MLKPFSYLTMETSEHYGSRYPDGQGKITWNLRKEIESHELETKVSK